MKLFTVRLPGTRDCASVTSQFVHGIHLIRDRNRPVIRFNRQGNVTKLTFYLADVEAFVEPIAVVPDIGGPPNAYFVCKNRAKWREDFVEWLREEDAT